MNAEDTGPQEKTSNTKHRKKKKAPHVVPANLCTVKKRQPENLGGLPQNRQGETCVTQSVCYLQPVCRSFLLENRVTNFVSDHKPYMSHPWGVSAVK